MIYYPQLLSIKVNGKAVSYQPTDYKDSTELYKDRLILAGVRLSSGSYTIESYFKGLWWANWISSSAWLMVILAAIFSQAAVLVKKRQRKAPMDYKVIEAIDISTG